MNFGDMIAKGGALFARKGSDALADTLETAPPADLARIQASVSGAAARNARRTLGSTPAHRLSYLLNNPSDGVNTCANYKLGFKIRQGCANPQFIYANKTVSNSPGTPEAYPVDTITVRAAVEISGAIWPIFFNGRRDVVLEPGAIVTSDPLPIVFAAGDLPYVRTCVSVAAAGQKWRTSGNYITTGVAAISGEGATLSTAYQDLTTSGTISNAYVYAYGPSGIIAQSNGAVAVARIGDSITFGQDTAPPQWGGSYYGYQARILDALGIGHVNVALSGEQAKHYAPLSARPLRTYLTKFASHSIVGYGINDINNTTDTLAQIQANLLSIWAAEAASGKLVAQCTLMPCTASTNAWADDAGQSDRNARVTALWSALNAWIRTKPSPLSAVLPAGDAVMSSPLANKWRPGLTADGVHPSEAGHAALAADTALIDAVAKFLSM